MYGLADAYGMYPHVKPAHAFRGERLLNHSGIGSVELDKQEKPTRIEQIISEHNAILFEKNHEERTFE